MVTIARYWRDEQVCGGGQEGEERKTRRAREEDVGGAWAQVEHPALFQAESMCRETGVDGQLCGTDIDTLTSMQPPTAPTGKRDEEAAAPDGRGGEGEGEREREGDVGGETIVAAAASDERGEGEGEKEKDGGGETVVAAAASDERGEGEREKERDGGGETVVSAIGAPDERGGEGEGERGGDVEGETVVVAVAVEASIGSPSTPRPPPESDDFDDGHRSSAAGITEGERKSSSSGSSSSKSPLFARRLSGQSPKLLPYFPKPGVTSPPLPQSLARNPNPGALLRASAVSSVSSASSAQSPKTPPSKTGAVGFRNPSSPASKSATSNGNASSSSSAGPSPKASPLASKPGVGRNPPFPSSSSSSSPAHQSSRATARNPSPTPSSFARSSFSSGASPSTNHHHNSSSSSSASASRATARNASPTPGGSSTRARNPSPSPAVSSSRSTARNSSPAPALRALASGRTSSPAPSCRASKAQGTSPLSSTSFPLSKNLASSSSNRAALTSAAASRRAASPALVRKDPSSRSSVLPNSDNGRHQHHSSSTTPTPEAAAAVRKASSTLGSPAATSSSPALPEISKSLSRSFKDRGGGGGSEGGGGGGAAVSYLPQSNGGMATMVCSPVKKLLSPAEQKRERIGLYGRKSGGSKSGRVACEGMLPSSPPVQTDTRKRCHWITPQSDSELVLYHDEVWGSPVHDDRLLFELLVLEGSQSELTRPQMLSMREYFREVWEGFVPEVVSKFDEKKVAALKVDEVIRQPEAKLRGVIENAKHLLKIVEEFGSFDKYLWNFVGFKPIVNSARIFTQIPAKSSKSDALSKDLMRRGFRYVGPTTVYSFMQAAGMVNDHLVGCFRHRECMATTAQMQVQAQTQNLQGMDINSGNSNGSSNDKSSTPTTNGVIQKAATCPKVEESLSLVQ